MSAALNVIRFPAPSAEDDVIPAVRRRAGPERSPAQIAATERWQASIAESKRLKAAGLPRILEQMKSPGRRHPRGEPVPQEDPELALVHRLLVLILKRTQLLEMLAVTRRAQAGGATGTGEEMFEAAEREMAARNASGDRWTYDDDQMVAAIQRAHAAREMMLEHYDREDVPAMRQKFLIDLKDGCAEAGIDPDEGVWMPMLTETMAKHRLRTIGEIEVRAAEFVAQEHVEANYG